MSARRTPIRTGTKPALNRRQWGVLGAAALAGLAAREALAQSGPPPVLYLGDMHSHYATFRPRLFNSNLHKHMQDTGTMLVAWATTDDNRWIRSSAGALIQVGEPAPGELWDNFQSRLNRNLDKLKSWALPAVLTPADVDAALAGRPHVVLACESANFLEGKPERVALAHGWGLRHLQMVHFIHSPLGDHQTAEPRHQGITPVGLQVIGECKRLGMVVDLAHSSPAFVDGALDGSDATMLWSHSWISPGGGSWRDPGYLARSLSPAQAKKIAAHGGLVGLWTVRMGSFTPYPVSNVQSFADETLRMSELLGPQHVAFGTDMEGAGSNPILDDYKDLREVANRLVQLGLPQAALQDIFIGNYARLLKQAMLGATPT
jgi:membrane dipeptidase